MATLKSLVGLAAVAALLGGCADYPYYGDGYNGYGYNGYNGYGYNGYGYDAGPGYYDPGYTVAPEIGLGFAFSDGGRHEHWRDRHDWRDDDHHRHDDRH
jgi:hypothetical protein